MGLDMYLRACKYNGGGWRHHREDIVDDNGQRKAVPKKFLPPDCVEFDRIVGQLGFSSYEDWIKRFPHGCSAEISINVAYWRKDNQIHNWFVQNTQDGRDECDEFHVSHDQLRQLQDICNKVLATVVDDKVDARVAHELLPTQGGFFFGNTNYDEDYIDGLRNTVTQLDAVLADDSPFADETQWDFKYRASW